MRAILAGAALLLSLALAACGGSTVATVENTQFNPALHVDLKSSTRLPSGLYYRDLVPGTGAEVVAGQPIGIHYTGWLADGTSFGGNTSGQVFGFLLGAKEIIAGLNEGLAGARVGGKRQLIIPPALAYGASGNGAQPPNAIPPNAVLVIEVRIDWNQLATVEATQFSPSLNVDLKSFTPAPNGEYYRDLVAGTGAPVATGQTLAVHYTGWLADGTQFETNTGGPAFSFKLGANQVIPGWEQGLPGARVGGARQLLIPPGLGYGIVGSRAIPPNAVLVFTVQIDAAQ